MIVDIHTHVWLYPDHLSEEVASEILAARDLRRQVADLGLGSSPPRLTSQDLTAVNTTLEDHWQHAQNADFTLVLAVRSRALGIHVPNEYVAQYVNEHPERLAGFACVDLNDKDAVDEMEECVHRLGLHGLKLLPIYQHFDPTESRFFPLYERAQDLDIPILWHMGATVLRRAPLKLSHPLLLQDIALRFPRLRMIVAHLAHPWEVETIALLRQCPNLWADISALHYRPWRFYNSMITAVEYGVFDKILLGSDFSAATIPDTMGALRSINDVVEGTNLPRVPDGVIEAIIHENWRGVVPEFGKRG